MGAGKSHLLGAGIDHVLELAHWDRKRLHNLKYFTWVEQQGKTGEELDAQWDDPDSWTFRDHGWRDLDDRIREFNRRTGLLKRSSSREAGLRCGEPSAFPLPS